MIELIGGPLDGDFTDADICLEKPFVVFPSGICKTQFCMYKLIEGKLIYLETKTIDQIRKEKENL